MDYSANLAAWYVATANLNWGIKRVLRETLRAVADEQVTLVYGADYLNGKPCLINAVRQMTSQGEIPPGHFAPEVVRSFDAINAYLEAKGVNNPETRIVSPTAADVLLRHFGEVKDAEVEWAEFNDVIDNSPYREISDEDILKDWLKYVAPEAN